MEKLHKINQQQKVTTNPLEMYVYIKKLISLVNSGYDVYNLYTYSNFLIYLFLDHLNEKLY